MSLHIFKRAKWAMLAMLALSATTALADSVYNDAFFRYDINMKNAEIQLTGASTHASLGDIQSTCSGLYDAVDAFDHALIWLEKAENAPPSADDQNRLSAPDITSQRATINDQKTKVQNIIANNCQAYPKK